MSLILCFLKAFFIGFAIAAPVGPIGMLCIRKTIEFGFAGALAVGLGAAIADGVYGVIAATGFSALINYLIERTTIVQIIGGAFLLYLACKEILNKPSNIVLSNTSHGQLGKLSVEVFFLALANPMTILSFIGVFASIGVISTNPTESIFMVLGIFIGSMVWWIILGSFIIKIKHKLPEVFLAKIRYFSALILGGFGGISIYSGIMPI